jgi:acyl dehydratase
VFHGDTLHCTTEVLSRRESRSRPDVGIVEFLHKAFNQHGDLVAECKRQAMMHKRPKT